jgi:hypothetical protein
MKIVITNTLKISKITKSHFRLTLSIITPANRARINPGVVAAAIILPKANSEPVSSRTSQLNAIRLRPNPIREIMLPRKNNKKVLLNRILSMLFFE